MPKQLINTGATSNDGTGDTLRQGALKVNANFNEIYSILGDGLTISPPSGSSSNSGYANTAGISSDSQKLNGQLPSYYLNYLNLTNRPTALSAFTNDTGFITKVVDESGLVVNGIVTATSYRGDGSKLTGISTAVDVGILQAQINSLGTNLNIVGFYDAVIGIITGLTIVGQGRTNLGIGLTLPSVGINTGDYFIVSKGGTDVGIATYTNPGISSVYSGDWIVGIDGDSWSILSYSQQVVAPRANRADIADAIDGNATINLSGIISALSFSGNGGGLTGLTGASPGTYGNSFTVPSVTVDGTGKISGITNVAIAITEIAAGYGTAYWSKNATGLTTTSAVAVGGTVASEALEVYGNIKINPTSLGSIHLYDNIRLKVGTGTDAEHYYDGTGYKIKSRDTVSIIDINNNPAAVFNAGGSVELYDGLTKKFETIGFGVTVIGSYYGDGSKLTGVITSITAGSNVDVQITGGIATISSSGGTGSFTKSVLGIGTTSSVGVGTTLAPGESTLYVLGNSDITGRLNVQHLGVSGVTTLTSGRIQIPASTNIKIGNNSLGTGSQRNIGIGDQTLASVSGGPGHNIGLGEFALYNISAGSYNLGLGDRSGQLMTSGNYNVILGSFQGQSADIDIRTLSNNVVISDGQGNVRQYINSDGNVGIKTTLITEALTVAGIVSATGLFGTLDASHLTGQLPALDGSLLTGVVATGQGIEIREDGSVLGVAATVNFGANVNVTLSAGIATVTANPNYWNQTGIGIHTLGSVGIATTNPTSTLTVGGDASFKGEVKLNGYGLRLSDAATIYESSLTDEVVFSISTGTDTFGEQGSFVFKTTDPGIPPYLRDTLRIYSAGDGPDRLVRVYRNLQVDNNATIANYLNVGSATTIISGAINVTGVITATTFSGDASNLTNLQSNQLNGALPALDGSALLNVNATGSGIVVVDDAINVGSARTINFGQGIDVDYSTSGIATVSASGGSLRERKVVVGVTSVLAPLGIGFTNIVGDKTYGLMKVGLSTNSWLRLYTDSASRDNDLSRSVGEDPAPGSGVVAEIVTTGISTHQILSPFVMGGNLDEPANTTIYASIKNLSDNTQSITTYLTILQLEA
jgi:hypothetical protein